MEDIKDKAATHLLCEQLGFDEGEFYFNLLNKRKDDEKHSHSKNYRILNNLFNLGAIGKIRNIKDKSEIQTYIPLPPTFLFDVKSTKNDGLIGYLEKIYLKNYGSLYTNGFLEIVFSYNNRLAFFLINNFMEKYAYFLSGGSESYIVCKNHMDPKKVDKITYLCRSDFLKTQDAGIKALPPQLIGNRRMLIIDGKIAMELLRVPNSEAALQPEATKYMGYVLSMPLNIKEAGGSFDYIKELEEEFKKLESKKS
jgi:hypothetical protein